MDTRQAPWQGWGRNVRAALAGLMALGLVAADATAPAWSAERGVRNPRQNARQHRQDARIRQGIRSGELTREEVKGLREKRREIRQEERAFKSDGSYTADERAKVSHDLNDMSRDIYREKHDTEVQPRVEKHDAEVQPQVK